MSRALKITFAAVVVALALAGWQCNASAQQLPEDGRIAIYKQLLARSQDEVATMGAQAQAAQVENAQLKAELAKLKAPSDIQSDGKPVAPAKPLDAKP